MLKLNTTQLKQNVVGIGLSLSLACTQCMIAYSDAFSDAQGAVGQMQGKLVQLADVLFPFSLVCLIIAILFTHDQKALSMELKTALFICVAYVALKIVVNAGFAKTFSDLISGAAGTGTST